MLKILKFLSLGLKKEIQLGLLFSKEKNISFNNGFHYSSEGSSLAIFDNLTEGQWALSIDATGYTFPTASVFNFPEMTEASVELTPLLNDNLPTVGVMMILQLVIQHNLMSLSQLKLSFLTILFLSRVHSLLLV